MSKKIQLLAVAAFVAVATFAMAPGDARADEVKELRECLEAAKDSSNEEQSRSMCLWKHYAYMASYGP